jgi:hypothetical protein
LIYFEWQAAATHPLQELTLIEINRETGTVIWDNFRLHPHLTHDEFVQQYPTIEVHRNIYNIGGIHDTVYQFPKINIGDNFLTPYARYENHRLSHVGFDVDELIYNEYRYSKDQSDRAMIVRQLYDTSDKLRKLLITHLGQPHENKKIFDANFWDFKIKFTDDDIQAIQGWSYRFEWGVAYSNCSYDDFGKLNLGIGVFYFEFFQINTWEIFAAECDTRIRNEQEQNRDVAELLAMRLLIDILSLHFEFLKLKPLFHLGNVMFLGCPVETRTFLKINPNDIKNRYEIRRQDKREKFFIAEGDNSRLIDTLRLFFEAETL